MAKPINKFGKGSISLAVFEQQNEKSNDKEFYSLQRSRKIGNEWKNENILLNKQQLLDVQEVVAQALKEGA